MNVRTFEFLEIFSRFYYFSTYYDFSYFLLFMSWPREINSILPIPRLNKKKEPLNVIRMHRAERSFFLSYFISNIVFQLTYSQQLLRIFKCILLAGKKLFPHLPRSGYSYIHMQTWHELMQMVWEFRRRTLGNMRCDHWISS